LLIAWCNKTNADKSFVRASVRSMVELLASDGNSDDGSGDFVGSINGEVVGTNSAATSRCSHSQKLQPRQPHQAPTFHAPQPQRPPVGLRALLLTPSLRVRGVTVRTVTVSVCYLWFAVTCSYYGLGLYCADLGGSIYVNVAVATLLEGPSYGAVGTVLEWAGRRPTLAAGFGQSGLCCLVLAWLGASGGWVASALAFTSKTFVTLAYGSLYVYGAEIFPTEVRQSPLLLYPWNQALQPGASHGAFAIIFVPVTSFPFFPSSSLSLSLSPPPHTQTL